MRIIRTLDFVLALFGVLCLWPIMLLVYGIGLCDTGSPIFIQQRVGRHQRPFNLIKFRTMAVATESVATHLASRHAVTPVGHFLRKTKLDELPQLINVLRGEMSLVGPRPCLFSQHELIAARDEKGVFEVLPGITGLAQINAIDMSTPELLAEWDQRMINSMSIKNYFIYLVRTVSGKGAGDRIR